MADPLRNQFFVVRSDQNEVLAFNGTNYSQIAALPTGNQPNTMAISFDQQYLLVGNSGSQIVNVYDLDTLQPVSPIVLPSGFVALSIASSANATLAQGGYYDGTFHILQLDIAQGTGVELPSLGVFNNLTNANTVMTTSQNGSTIFIAQADGTRLSVQRHFQLFCGFPARLHVAGRTVRRIAVRSICSRSQSAELFAESGADVPDRHGYPVRVLLRGPDWFPFHRARAGGHHRYHDHHNVRRHRDRRNLHHNEPHRHHHHNVHRKREHLNLHNHHRPSHARRPRWPEHRSGGNGTHRHDQAASSVSNSTQMMEAPLLGSTASPFTRTIAPLANQTAIMNLTVSGVTVMPWNFAASVAPPDITSVVNAGNYGADVAPGGLISVFGTNLSPVNMASSEIPLPTALANSCLSVNGLPVPILFVSPTQVNAQMPFQAIGDVTLVLRTPGGISNSLNLVIDPNAPSVFSASVGADNNIPTVVRYDDGELVTPSHPIHRSSNSPLVIYLTGLGGTSPAVPTGQPAPSNPLSLSLVQPTVTLGGVSLPVLYAGLAPGLVGVDQINVSVPTNVPTGMSVPLVITEGDVSTSISERVEN